MKQGRLFIGAAIALLAAMFLVPAAASALNQVTWSPVGPLSVLRDYPAAATLPDGRVLVVGGYTGPNTYYNTAEIFDPKTNAFSSTGIGSMAHGRYGPTATTLRDGRVLIAGGYDGSAEVPEAEVFNPATQSFSPVGSMIHARDSAAAALLPDGRVLIAGGENASSTLASTEIFNPKTNSFSAGPDLPEGTYGPAAGTLPNGNVLIAGGYDGNGPGVYLSSSVLFNPSTGSFLPTAPLAEKRYAPGGAQLPGGRVLLAGGSDGMNLFTSSEVFDPNTSSFSSAGIGPLGVKREEAAAAELHDGRVLIAGGRTSGVNLKSAELLSVPSNAFKAKLKGRKVIFTVTNEGTGEATDTSTKLATTAKKKKKKPKLVKTTTKQGGPGKIVVKIKLTKQGAAKLAQKGKLQVKVAFTPQGGLAAAKKLKLRAGK